MTAILVGTPKGSQTLSQMDSTEGRLTPKKVSYRPHSHSTSDFSQRKRPQILTDNFPKEDPAKTQGKSPDFRIKSRPAIDSDSKSDSLQSPPSKPPVFHSGELRIKSSFSALKTPNRDNRSVADKLEDPSTTNASLGYYLRSPKAPSGDIQEQVPKTTTNSSLAARPGKVLSDSFTIQKPSRTQSDETAALINNQNYFLAKPKESELHKSASPGVAKGRDSSISKAVLIPEVTGGAVKAFGATTNDGIVRKYNEDKVSIILNILKPSNLVNENWPRCSFFGVYDGHGGSACADFLRDNLYRFVSLLKKKIY